MIWSSASEFFYMGGYGPYVWGSYGVAVVLMGVEPVLAMRRRRRALREAAGAEVWDDASAPRTTELPSTAREAP